MVNITINGTDYEVKKDATILDVAKDNGIYVPTLCYLEGVSDIGPMFTRDQQCADIYHKTDLEKIWWHSPLKYADDVKTPTLFIHSDQDYRCPFEQGIQFFTALKTRGVETRMCVFHGENHELSRNGKPLHRMRRLNEITDWMNGHLKEED